MARLAPLGDTYQAGTLSGNPVAMTAGLATLDLLEREHGWERLEALGARARGHDPAAACACAVPGALGADRFALLDVAARGRGAAHRGGAHRARDARFAHLFHAMLERGVYLPPSAYEALLPVAGPHARRPRSASATPCGTRSQRSHEITRASFSSPPSPWCWFQWCRSAGGCSTSATTRRQTIQAERAGYADQAAAAQGLLEGGMRPERIHELLPKIAISDGQAALAPEVSEALVTEERSRHRQYAWEGGVLPAGARPVHRRHCPRPARRGGVVARSRTISSQLVSHQFKTPLASLQLSLETLALRTPPPAQARVLIDRMLSDLSRMELMVTQILESARLERGRVDFKSEPLQLAGAVARDHRPARGAHQEVAGEHRERHRAGLGGGQRSARPGRGGPQRARERARRAGSRAAAAPSP